MADNLKAELHKRDRTSVAQRHWLWQVTALALFLGAILGASLRAQDNFRRHNIFSTRSGVPAGEYAKQVKRGNDLQAEIVRLNEDKRRLTEAYSGSAKLSTLKMELGDAKAFAALTGVTGPGVIVTLSDVPRAKVKAMGISPEESLIHDVDILQVVNELRAAGADAIAINDQRLAATSPIRCVGDTVLINTTPVGVPLRIKAIGDQTALYSGLKMNGGIMDPESSRLALLNMISITRESAVQLPAFAGPTNLRHGKPMM